MQSHGKVWFFVVVLSTLIAAVGAQGASDCSATVSAFWRPPVIDGKISGNEWDGAVRTVGFEGGQSRSGLNLKFLETRKGTTYVGFTEDRLYIAVVSEMPPDGKQHAAKTNRDSDVIFDEGIEIWIDPNREHRESGEGDQSFYQFIGNSIGTIYDVRFDPVKGTPDIGWNGHWEYQNTYDAQKFQWTAELSIPFADLGWEKGKVIGRRIGVLVARNFKNPWTQVTWFPHEGAFVSWTEYPEILLTKDLPSVQITGLGDRVHQGELDLQLSVFNPGPARQATVSLDLTSSDMPGLKDEKTLDLPAHGSAAYRYLVPPNRFHEQAQHAMHLVVADPSGKPVYLGYRLSWTKAFEPAWTVRVGPNPEAAMRIGYYPSFGFVRLFLDPRELGEEPGKATSAMVHIEGPDRRVVLDKRVAWEALPVIEELKVGDLPDGDYTVRVELAAWKEPLIRDFKRVHFPWEGNRLGVTSTVYPPFKPIVVSGQNVGVVLRDYGLSGLGLWNSVRSVGREILAGPITLKVNDGAVLDGRGRFTSQADDRVVYEGSGGDESVSIKTRCTTEYDGCMKVELSLAPGSGGKEIRRLWLDIPLKDEAAPLWHCTTTGLRFNPAGRTPSGEGDVWDSRQFPDGNWAGNFKCYLWLGGEERGLCWFADNDAGWVLDFDKAGNFAPCLVLSRRNGVLTLRVNLIQKPVTLVEPRKIVFGLMASPAKPMMSGWRRIGYSGPGFESVGFNMSYAGDNVCSAKYPHAGDMTILDMMQEARLTGRADTNAFNRIWALRHGGEGMAKPVMDRLMNLNGVVMRVSANRQPWYSYYFEEFHSTCQTHPESHVFQAEWSGGWNSRLVEKLRTELEAPSIPTGNLVASYQDFCCWYGAEYLRRGIGLYFDNAFPKRAYDPLTTSAYKMSNGQIQPSAGMWAHREYLKRIWVLHQQLAQPVTRPLMVVHMTNTHVIPYLSFNMANLDLEWFYGPEPQQSKYPYDMLRAETLGRQSGCLPLAIALVDKTKTKEEEAFANRTRFGVLMVHEIKSWLGNPPDAGLVKLFGEFGYGRDDCQVWNYWDENCPVQVPSEKVKTLLLKRDNRLLLLLVTWSQSPEPVTVKLDTDRIGLAPKTAADAETGAEVPLAGAAFTLELGKYDVRVIRLE